MSTRKERLKKLSQFSGATKGWVNLLSGENVFWSTDWTGRPHHDDKMPTPKLQDKIEWLIDKHDEDEDALKEELGIEASFPSFQDFVWAMAKQDGWISIIIQDGVLFIRSDDDGEVATILDKIDPSYLKDIHTLSAGDHTPNVEFEIPEDVDIKEAWDNKEKYVRRSLFGSRRKQRLKRLAAKYTKEELEEKGFIFEFQSEEYGTTMVYVYKNEQDQKRGWEIAAAPFRVRKDSIQIGRYRDGGVYVDPKYRRLGLATIMYDMVEKETGLKVEPDKDQSSDAKKFWENRRSRIMSNRKNRLNKLAETGRKVTFGNKYYNKLITKGAYQFNKNFPHTKDDSWIGKKLAPSSDWIGKRLDIGITGSDDYDFYDGGTLGTIAGIDGNKVTLDNGRTYDFSNDRVDGYKLDGGQVDEDRVIFAVQGSMSVDHIQDELYDLENRDVPKYPAYKHPETGYLSD